MKLLDNQYANRAFWGMEMMNQESWLSYEHQKEHAERR